MTYLPPLSAAFFGSALYQVPAFKQGHRIGDGDLDAAFMTMDGDDLSPHYIAYQVGEASGQNFHPIGSDHRIPVEMRTGRFRPNFQIGDSWRTGYYEVRWTYQMSNGDAPQMGSSFFIVSTSGIYDVPGVTGIGYTGTGFTGVAGFTGYTGWNPPGYTGIPGSTGPGSTGPGSTGSGSTGDSTGVGG
jgi:hypothetical protein